MKKKLLVFGYGLALIALVLATGGLLKHKHMEIKYILLFSGSLCLAIVTAIDYKALEPVYIVWMKVAQRIGLVVTTLLLTIIFFLIFTPVALLLRLLGKDYMQRKWDKEATTYWIKKDLKLFSKEDYQQQF